MSGEYGIPEGSPVNIRDASLLESLQRVLFVGILVTSLIQQTYFPEIIYLLSVIPATLLFGLVAIYTDSQIRIPRYGLVAYATIWLIYFPHAILPTFEQFPLIRIPVFMVSSFILLFIVPQRVPVERLFSTIFYVATGLAIFGLASFIPGIEQILGYPLTMQEAATPLPVTGELFEPLSSLMANPNSLAKVTAFGSLAGITVYRQQRQPHHLLFLCLIFVTLLLTLSRGSLISLVGGVVVLGLVTYERRDLAGIVAFGIIVGSVYTMLAVSGTLPDPFGISGLFHYDRARLWAEAIERLETSALFGIGFQPLEGVVGKNNIHSAFVFVLLTRGVAGFAVHIAFLTLILRQLVYARKTDNSATLLALFVMWIILMTFSSAALFGFALNAVWPSIIVGYSMLLGHQERRSCHKSGNDIDISDGSSHRL